MTIEDEASEAEQLAEAVKDWRHRVSAREAADILGMPKRTLDGIEQARPFRYAKLLKQYIGTAEAKKEIERRLEAKRKRRREQHAELVAAE